MEKRNGNSRGGPKSYKDRKRKKGCETSNRNVNGGGSVGKPEATHNLDTQEIKANDPKWYMNGPAGPVAFAVPFSEPAGKPITLEVDSEVINAKAAAYKGAAMPAIMTLEYMPTYGVMHTISDPINTSLTRLHTMLRYGQSYAHTYDAAHLGAHMIMADQLFTLITMLRRAYGLMRWYSSVNRNMPQLYLRSLGFNQAAIGSYQLEDFRQYINTLVRKVAMVKVPKNWVMFQRHQFMCETVYMDSPTVKAQMYAFVPAFFYKYTISSDTWSLTPSAFDATKTSMNLTDVKAYCNAIVDSYIYEEDCTIISADMLRIYGAEGCYQVSEIDMNYTTNFVYDPTIIAQIHNCTVLGVGFSEPNVTPYLDITQDMTTGALSASPAIKIMDAAKITSAMRSVFQKLLDAPQDAPGVDYVAEATRLMGFATATKQSDGGVTFALDCFGTEVVTNANVWLTAANGVMAATSPYGVTSNSLTPFLDVWKFDNAPIALFMTLREDTYRCVNIIGNINNYAVISRTMLQNMHQNAQYSVFDVPVLDSATITFKK